MQPRRDRRPARRRPDLLPAFARGGRYLGAGSADLCLRQGRGRAAKSGAVAITAGETIARPAARASEGAAMSTPANELTVLKSAVPPGPLDVTRLRQDFPILRQTVTGKPLVYLDTPPTTHNPPSPIQPQPPY